RNPSGALYPIGGGGRKARGLVALIPECPIFRARGGDGLRAKGSPVTGSVNLAGPCPVPTERSRGARTPCVAGAARPAFPVTCTNAFRRCGACTTCVAPPLLRRPPCGPEG